MTAGERPPEIGDPAPDWDVTEWLNGDGGTPASYRGRVLYVCAFQMLCPGCVSQGLPQARNVAAAFGDAVAVVGLHTVFEHHEANSAATLAAFLHENRIGFPVGIDRPAAQGTIPTTMARYAMRGTPTTLIVDKRGVLQAHAFGHVDDLRLGALLGQLLAQPS